MRTLWKYYPIVFPLPFLLAALAFESLAKVGELGRWAVMAGALAIPAACSSKFLTFRLKPHNWMFFLFLAVSMLSWAWSINPTYSLWRAISMVLLYGALFFGFRAYVTDFSPVELLKKLAGTIAVFLCLNLVLSVALGYSIGVGRFQGFFSNPNGVGSMAGVVAPVLFYLALSTKRLIWMGLLGLTIVSLLLAGSRGPLIASLFSIAICSLPILRRRAVQVLVLGGAGAIGLGYFSTTEYFEENVLREDTIETMSNRTEFWELGKGYIAERPWLGFGFGTDAEIHEYHGLILTDLKIRGYGVMSSYLGLAVQIGIPFTIVFYSYFILSTAISGFRHWRDPMVMACVGWIGGGLLIGIGESVLYSAGNAFGFLFWCFPMLLVHRLHEIRILERKRAIERTRGRGRKGERISGAAPRRAKAVRIGSVTN